MRCRWLLGGGDHTQGWPMEACRSKSRLSRKKPCWRRVLSSRSLDRHSNSTIGSMALAAAARQSIWLLAAGAPAARALSSRLCRQSQLQRAHRLLHTTARTTARRALDSKLVPHADTAVYVRPQTPPPTPTPTLDRRSMPFLQDTHKQVAGNVPSITRHADLLPPLPPCHAEHVRIHLRLCCGCSAGAGGCHHHAGMPLLQKDQGSAAGAYAELGRSRGVLGSAGRAGYVALDGGHTSEAPAVIAPCFCCLTSAGRRHPLCRVRAVRAA